MLPGILYNNELFREAREVTPHFLLLLQQKSNKKVKRNVVTDFTTPFLTEETKKKSAPVRNGLEIQSGGAIYVTDANKKETEKNKLIC